jgi:peptide chain release factor subunit 1
MPLKEMLDRLAIFEPVDLPVISLYLNTQADGRGDGNIDSFVIEELKAKAQTFPLRSPARASFDTDAARIIAYMENLRLPSNGVAIFACAGAGDFFETFSLDAPVDDHKLYVCREPHLYPLARQSDEFPRYAALVANEDAARIYVFGIGENPGESSTENANTGRTQPGGWSQARYQRHIKNYHLHHAKEVVVALEQVVLKDNVKHIVLAGDEAILAALRKEFPPHLIERVIDTLRLDIATPEHVVAERTLESLQKHEEKMDADRVERLLDEYRACGLAVVGVQDTHAALSQGRVDELYLSASLETICAGDEQAGCGSVDESQKGEVLSGGSAPMKVKVREELVKRALLIGANVTFIEDAALLADIGGVGATLRY